MAVEDGLLVVSGATPVVPTDVATRAATAPRTAEVARGQVADALVGGLGGLVAGT